MYEQLKIIIECQNKLKNINMKREDLSQQKIKELKEFLETLLFHGYIDHDITKLNDLIEQYFPSVNKEPDWILSSELPTNSKLKVVIVDNFKYPTIGWYSHKTDEWVLEDKEVSGKVMKWCELPNY